MDAIRVFAFVWILFPVSSSAQELDRFFPNGYEAVWPASGMTLTIQGQIGTITIDKK